MTLPWLRRRFRRRWWAVATAAALGSIILAACGGAGGQDPPAPAQAPGIGGTERAPRDSEPAPQVRLAMFDGSMRSLSDLYRDQPLVVNFWASWCPPCTAEMPDIEKVHQQLGDQVAFLGINTQDSDQGAHDIAQQTGVTYPLAWDRDGEIFRAFGVFGMPSTFFITPDGQLVERHTGLLTEEALREKITESLLKGTS